MSVLNKYAIKQQPFHRKLVNNKMMVTTVKKFPATLQQFYFVGCEDKQLKLASKKSSLYGPSIHEFPGKASKEYRLVYIPCTLTTKGPLATHLVHVLYALHNKQ